MKHLKLKTNEEGIITLQMPNGVEKQVSVLFGYQEPGDQFPELNILFDESYVVNCFSEDLSFASRLPNRGEHVRLAKQLIIPIE